jgi:hypothetical protein
MWLLLAARLARRFLRNCASTFESASIPSRSSA